MGREALQSSDVKIKQKSIITDDPNLREPEIVTVENSIDKDYADALAFGDEWVTIRINPSPVPNAPASYPVWVNGKGCEVMTPNGRVMEMPYLPVGAKLTIKRKYLEVLARAKLDTVHTEIRNKEDENPLNNVSRVTSAACSFAILEDKNPRGIAWISELINRNF